MDDDDDDDDDDYKTMNGNNINRVVNEAAKPIEERYSKPCFGFCGKQSLGFRLIIEENI